MLWLGVRIYLAADSAATGYLNYDAVPARLQLGLHGCRVAAVRAYAGHGQAGIPVPSIRRPYVHAQRK